VIISIELSDEDWGHVCGALDISASEADAYVDQMDALEDPDGDDIEAQVGAAAESRRIAGYITTIVGNAMERARPRFSEN
jgi:hypothetical protein